MYKIRVFIRLFLVLVIFRVPVFPQEIPFKNIDSYIDSALAEWRKPGLAIAIVKEGKIVFAKGYGVREKGKPERVDENTIFGVGSNSKAFTATALCILEQQGKLKLDDRVKKYIPHFGLMDSMAAERATIRDLLCHRIGLGQFHGDFYAWGSDYSRRDIILMMKNIKPAFEFRSGFGYCNSAFIAAGEIIPAVTGKSWDDFVKENLIIPLGMKRTATKVEELKNFDNLAAPHTVSLPGGEIIPIPYRNLNNFAAAGSITSSVKDMANWLIFQLDTGSFKGKSLVPFKTLSKTHVPNNPSPRLPYFGRRKYAHFSSYGLGWFLEDYNGRVIIQHSCGVDGMFSQTAFLPEEKLGIVILTNTDQNSLMTAMMYQVVDAYLGLPFKNHSRETMVRWQKNNKSEIEKWQKIEKEKDPKSKPSLGLDQHTGEFVNEMLGKGWIKKEGENLVLELESHPGVKGNLTHWKKDSWLCYFSDPEFQRCILPFTVDKGEVRSFVLSVNDFIDPLAYEFKKPK